MFRRKTPAPARPPKPPADHKDVIGRIDELTRTARGLWLGLLGYLAFIGVTLLGVEDPDFFLSERQTDLPLVGVSIPTASFFYFAPLLAAALFTYLHLHLLKLWEALARAPERIGRKPFSEFILPWLVSDTALALRPNYALRPRPLRWIAHGSTVILVFLATPAVLAGFWWRSMPAHDEAMTVIFCGGPLLLSAYVAATSWHRLRRLTNPAAQPQPRRRAIWRKGLRSLRGLTALLVIAIGLSRTVEGPWARLGTERDLAEAWWNRTPLALVLARAQLFNVDFALTPPDWKVRDEAEGDFRPTWCKDRGIPSLVCTAPSDDPNRTTWARETARTKWCGDHPDTSHDCPARLAELDTTIVADWNLARQRALEALPTRDFAGRKFVNAHLGGSDLTGANLREARLDGAILWQARLEGANLREAWLVRANLGFARLEGANLRFARLEGANLGFARLEGANLSEAHLEGAYLRDSRLEGANLGEARLEGANLGGAMFDRETILQPYSLRGAGLKNNDLSVLSPGDGFDQTLSELLQETFGDASVILPDGIDRPAHWPTTVIDPAEWLDQWRAFQASIGYVPPARNR